MRNILVAVTAVFLSTFGLTAPAHASGTEFRVYRDTAIVKFEGCRDYPVTYTIPDEVVTNAASWSLDITVYDPRGVAATFAFLYADADPSSGTAPVQICESELAGTWTLDAKLEWYDSSWENEYSQQTSDAFSVKKSASRTGIAVNDTTASYGQKLTFTVSSRKQFPNGFYAEPYVTVRLQKYASGAWRTFATRTTNQYGKARFSGYWKIRTTTKVRAITPATAVSTSSISRVITIY